MKRLAISLFFVLVVTLSLFAGCAGEKSPAGELEGKLPIFHAGSLTIPFDEINKEFNQLYPDIKVLTEPAGSATTIRKVTELGRECGVIASADYTLIPEMMFPEYADWYITFAYNEIVLAYTIESQFSGKINVENWYEILQCPGVSYGRSDPNQDPCGYRTLMVWQLAEFYYKVSGLHNQLLGAPGDRMRPKSVNLIALLESGDLDYAFEYLSVAVQHKLNFIELPPEINLSSEQFKDFYSKAEVEIAGKQPGEFLSMKGAPVVYGVTIPKTFSNQELAIAWVDFLLSKEGQAIMEANGQPPIKPAGTNDISKLPAVLKKHVR